MSKLQQDTKTLGPQKDFIQRMTKAKQMSYQGANFLSQNNPGKKIRLWEKKNKKEST